MSSESIQQQRAWDTFIGSGGATFLVILVIWIKIKKFAEIIKVKYAKQKT